MTVKHEVLNLPEDALRRIYLAAVKSNGLNLQNIPLEYRTLEICSVAVRKSGEALNWTPEEHKPLLIHDAIASGDSVLGLLSAQQDFFTEEMMLIAVTWNPLDLIAVPEHLRTHPVCMAAVKGQGRALKDVPLSILDKDLCMTAVRERGYPLKYVPKELLTEDLCIAAVTRMGTALSSVPDEMKTEEICWAAVRETPFALEYVPARFRSKKLVSHAISQNSSALQYIPVAERTKEMCSIAIESKNLIHLSYSVPPWVWDEELLLELSKIDGDAMGRVLEAIMYYQNEDDVSKLVIQERHCKD